VEFRPAQGAWVGLISAVFFAIVGTTTGAIVRAIMPAPDLEQLADQMANADLPPEAVDMALQIMDLAGTPGGLLIVFLVQLLLAAVFSTIGGLIGGSVFKVSATSPPPPAPTDPSATDL
jgi:hypothetical protein